MVNRNFLTKAMQPFLAPCLLGVFTLAAASSAWGQNYTFGKPQRLGENINSAAEESMPLLSPDGKSLYFVRTFYSENTGGRLSGQDIWLSQREPSGAWGPATNELPQLNNNRNNAVVGIEKNGQGLYLLNSYKPVSTKVQGVAKSILIANEWSQPFDMSIKGLETHNAFIGFYVSNDANAMIISMNADDAYGEEDLYISLKDSTGKWTEPENMGATVNTAGFEIAPFLSDDGKTLFFASDGHNGYGGSDVYMSKRLYDSWVVWSTPVNLGPQINSDQFDAYFHLHGDQAYFVSTREGSFSDIYMAEVLEIKPRDALSVTGGKKYTLTETEIQELLGVPVSRTITFEKGSYTLSASSRELIYFLANKLQDRSEYNIELVGHASQEGSEALNEELSLNRAQSVARQFMEYGLIPGRITFRGLGESAPLYEEGEPEEMAQNRRVEIVITK
jgi:outer membrane protein OmpA-like peptidoglycan-associated protein